MVSVQVACLDVVSCDSELLVSVTPKLPHPCPHTALIARHHAKQQRRLRAAVAKFRHAALCKAWASWRGHVQHRQVKGAMLQHCVRLWAGNTAIKCWLSWRAYAAAKKQHRAASSAAGEHYRRKVQRRALLALWLARLHGQEQRWRVHLMEGHMQGW